MNRKRMTNKWVNLALGIVILFVALSNGVDILGSNASWGRNSWGIGWTVVNIEMWVNLFWGVLIFVKRVPNWILLVFGVIDIPLFIYFNFYIKYFFWFQILALIIVCGYFAYGTYRDYREK